MWVVSSIFLSILLNLNKKQRELFLAGRLFYRWLKAYAHLKLISNLLSALLCLNIPCFLEHFLSVIFVWGPLPKNIFSPSGRTIGS